MSLVSTPTQYLTDKEGKSVGVVLCHDEYQVWQKDEDLLPGLSHKELHLLAQGMLATPNQARLSVLLAQVDQLNLLKARAQSSLWRRMGASYH